MIDNDRRAMWNANAPSWTELSRAGFAVFAAGLSIEAIAEPHADEQTARDHPEIADTRIAPYFLTLRARKPSGLIT